MVLLACDPPNPVVPDHPARPSAIIMCLPHARYYIHRSVSPPWVSTQCSMLSRKLTPPTSSIMSSPALAVPPSIVYPSSDTRRRPVPKPMAQSGIVVGGS
ncbi:hypothetical protein BD779DRAFT_698462 [Infundibulicybe gibba]|nr:hypothetical protein BD779DRAFT_698462 [Infundibulicybe gibba]